MRMRVCTYARMRTCDSRNERPSDWKLLRARRRLRLGGEREHAKECGKVVESRDSL